VNQFPIEYTKQSAGIWSAQNNSHHFLQISRELEFAGDFTGTIQRDFAFTKVAFQNDTYSGIGINLKYYLKVEMAYASTLMKSQLVEERELIVENDSKYTVNH
jgi:Vacuolar protein sorting-associated protein 26